MCSFQYHHYRKNLPNILCLSFKQLLSFVWISVAFPVAALVTIMFWVLYAIDPALLGPREIMPYFEGLPQHLQCVQKEWNNNCKSRKNAFILNVLCTPYRTLGGSTHRSRLHKTRTCNSPEKLVRLRGIPGRLPLLQKIKTKCIV